MQEVGKTRTTCGKILSIQSQLGGLSFYCGADKRYNQIQIAKEKINETIAKEIEGESYDHIDYFHNSPNYIIIPRPLFDENMCDAYLLTKGIEQQAGDVIRVTLTAEVAYISLIDGELNEVTTCCNIFPIIAKCYKYCPTAGGNYIAYILMDNILHVCYSESGNIKFCESLPLITPNDLEFFLGSIIKKYNLTTYTIEQLFHTGDFKIPINIKYKIVKQSQEKYLEI